MIRLNIVRKLAGDMLVTTWVCSGMFPYPISSALFGPGRTLVQSMSAVSSGQGFYYGLHQLPAGERRYVSEWRAWINSYEYVGRQIVDVREGAID